METNVDKSSKPALSNKVVIGAAAVVVAAVVGVGAFIVSRQPAETSGPTIGYATEATVMMDQDSLQAAIDEAMQNAQDGYVGLKYRKDAYSEDGKKFTCRIINSDANIYDMFLTIYADAELTDQIFLSGLVKPGSGFEEIELDRALESGDHTVYVALTQVDTDEETGEQVIKNQVMHTMDFHVET